MRPIWIWFFAFVLLADGAAKGGARAEIDADALAAVRSAFGHFPGFQDVMVGDCDARDGGFPTDGSPFEQCVHVALRHDDERLNFPQRSTPVRFGDLWVVLVVGGVTGSSGITVHN